MKVKISYTIDFDEVPTKVQNLLEGTLEELQSETSSLQLHGSDMDITKSKLEIISKLQTFRQSLMKYDMQLADYVNLLANYEKATLDIMTDNTEEEEQNESG